METTATRSRLAVALCWVQGLYYLVTGLWPLVSVETFEAVTGEKSDHLIAAQPTDADHWMLYTISALIIAIALVILAAAWRQRVSLDVASLGVMSALALTIIDVVYVMRRTIRPIYLADAAAEVLIIGGWGLVLRGFRPSAGRDVAAK